MKSSVTKSRFGKLPDGTAIEQFILANANGLSCKLITCGAALVELHAPDKNGKSGDVVLGFETMDDYLGDKTCQGATIGRFANRIAKGKFALGGKPFTLATNNGAHHLHGGPKGFDKVVWKAERLKIKNGAAVKFFRTSPNGEEGYPGTLEVAVTYSLTDKNELRIDYEATTDKPAPINLTNHSYWNLAGGGNILGHELMLAAANYTPAGKDLIPTGETKPVEGTPLDFTKPKPIGRDIAKLNPPGYDHNFVLESGGKKRALAARAVEPKSGRVMEILTDQPGIQLYTGNFLDGARGKRRQTHSQHAGFCLETQHFPDAVNHSHFPSTILRPGKIYRTTTVHVFSIQ